MTAFIAPDLTAIIPELMLVLTSVVAAYYYYLRIVKFRVM